MYAWRGGFSFLCTILLSSVEKFILSSWRNFSIIGRACAIQFSKKKFFFSKRVVVRWNMHTCNQRQIAINISLQFLAIHCLGFCSKRGFSILLFFYQNVYYTIYLNCQSFFLSGKRVLNFQYSQFTSSYYTHKIISQIQAPLHFPPPPLDLHMI